MAKKRIRALGTMKLKLWATSGPARPARAEAVMNQPDTPSSRTAAADTKAAQTEAARRRVP
ncbi:hypothetical protein D3C72_1979770 [compost metagenome]